MHASGFHFYLTLILLKWRIWWAVNNASRWQMGFNSAFKGLKWIPLLSIWFHLFRCVSHQNLKCLIGHT